jgi:serine/threonine-protein kinase
MTTPHPLPSTVAGRYRPIARLGSGGMGTVWEAVDDRLRRPVALKVASTADDGLAERSRAEARALAAVHHPNVVSVLDAGIYEGRAFVVTELVRGPSLRTLMAAGPMDPDRVARLGQQLASALACAHEHGVVHRDLTPANVLVDDESGEAKLIDFGIAMSEHAVGLTATGLVVGTPAYLAPEQVEGRRAAAASDVYALGLVLLEALTGRRPFPGGPTATTAARLVADAPMPDDLPSAWARVLGPMTRRNPAQRPSSASAAADLAALAPTTTAGPTGTPTLLDLTRADPATATTRMATATTKMAAGALPAAAASKAAPVAGPGGRQGPRDRRHRAWPLLLAGSALVLALAVVAGFGMWDRGGTADGPDAVATDTTAVTTSTGPSTTAPAAAVVTAAAPTTTTTTTAPAPAPAGKGKDAPATKGGGPGAKGKG